jgi:hypothetical protein
MKFLAKVLVQCISRPRKFSPNSGCQGDDVFGENFGTVYKTSKKVFAKLWFSSDESFRQTLVVQQMIFLAKTIGAVYKTSTKVFAKFGRQGLMYEAPTDFLACRPEAL